ncbi:MAG TPA: AAA family ATPase [Bacteroidales bacterium]|nr:AAA family ATPase [Bacteroidales bacterium]
MLSEKYRPQNLADVVGRDDIVESLVKYKKSKSIPNILMIGPAGTGKTTLAKLWIKYLHGESYKLNAMELNSSDENSIEVVRTKIKEFVIKKSLGSNYPKIVFLDEADRMSLASQGALKKIMESYDAKFILCANSDNIDAPIKSRCVVYRFNDLKDEDIEQRLKYIIEHENLEVSDKDINKIIKNASGDMRQAINLLQSVNGGIELSEEITNYKLLDLNIKDFEDKILYKYEAKKIIEKLFNEVIKAKKYDKISALATADYRVSLQTIKTLQVLDAFMQVKGE